MSQTSNTRIPNSIHPGIPKPAPKHLYEDTDSSYGWDFSHTLATPKLGKGDLPEKCQLSERSGRKKTHYFKYKISLR